MLKPPEPDWKPADEEAAAFLEPMALASLETMLSAMKERGCAYPFWVFQMPAADGEPEKSVIVPLPPEAAELLGDGAAKGAMFDLFRAFVRESGAKACCFVSVAWLGTPTEEGMAFPPEDFERIVKSDGGFETAVSMGLVKRTEGVTATAQNAEAVVVATQAFVRTGFMRNGAPSIRLEGEPQVSLMPQAAFADARLQMYREGP